MSKHYGIDGVGTIVELGKGGPKVADSAGTVEIKNNANNAYADVKAFKATLDTVQFATAPTVGAYAEGHLFYDATWKTLSAQIGRDVTLQIGQEDLRRVYNNTGVTLYDGQAVYATGVYNGGTNDVVTVALAKADSSVTAFSIGCLTQDIANGEYGFVTVRGHVNGLDTNRIGSAYLNTQGMAIDCLVGGTAGNAYTFEVINTTTGGLTYTEVGGAVIVDLGGATPTRVQLATLINTTTPSAYIQVHVEVAGNVIVASVLPFAGGVVTAAGDVLYLSAAIPGKLRIGVPDAPNLEIRVGRIITKSATVGRVNVRIYQGYRLNDLSDVVSASPTVDDTLKWNGTSWVNGPPVSSSASAGIEWWPDTTNIINKTTENDFVVETLGKLPVTSAESVEAIACTSNTVIGSAYLYDTALGRTTLEGGSWAFDVHCSVSSTGGGRISSATFNMYTVRPYTSPTVTVTGSGTSRTCTASSGTPFAVTKIVASATNTLASFVQTPKGMYQITAVTSDTEVTILTPTGYGNESTVGFSVWKKFGGVNTGTITALTTNYGLISKNFASSSVTIEVTDKLGMIVFGTSNNTTTVNYVYNGTANYSHVSSPLVTLHDNLAGLNAGNYRHFTATDYTDLTDGGTTTLHTHTIPVPTTITVAVEATDTSSFPLLVTASTGDLGPKTSSGWGLSTAHAYTGTGVATSGLPRMFLGTNAPSGDDSALLICRAIAGTDLFSHGVRDESTFTSLTTGAYASFDSIPVLNGNITYNHIASFQSRHQYAGGGTLTDSVGFSYALTTSGAVTASTAFRVYDYAGVGVVTNFYALYIPTLTKPTNHWTIYSTGTSKAYHAGNFGIGTTAPLSLLSVSGDTAAPTVFQDGNYGQVMVSSPSASANTVTKITFSTPSYAGAGSNAGIGVKWTGGGTEMMFGTSNTYTGISNTALRITPSSALEFPDSADKLYAAFGKSVDDGFLFCAGNDDNYANRNIIITDYANIAKDHDHNTLSVNPTLFIHSATDPDTNNTQWISLAHDQTNGVITTGKGFLSLTGAGGAGGTVNIGSTASAAALVAANDLIVSGKLEVQSIIYSMSNLIIYGSGATFYNSWTMASDSLGILSANAGTPVYLFNGATTEQLVWYIGTGHRRSFVLGDSASLYKNFDHALQPNPTLFIHSATDPDTNNTQWISLAHDQTNGVITTGKGDLTLTPATGRLVVHGSTNDGTTNIFVGRDSDDANVATLSTNGVLTLTGFGNAGTDTYIALTRTGGYGSTYLQQGYTASGSYPYGFIVANSARTYMSLLENASGGTGIQDRHIVLFPNAYRVGIGTATPAGHLHIVDDILCEFIMEAAYTHADYCPQINLKKCRTSIAAPTIVASGDRTALIGGMGYDGANYRYTGWMEFKVDGTPGSEDMPGRFVLSLTPDGSNAPTECFRVLNDKNFLIGTTDNDGTPATGRLVVQGSTSDGSTNTFVARTATGGNAAWLSTAGVWSCNGFSLYGVGDSTANGGMYSLYDDGVHIWVRCGTGYGCGNIIFTANIGVDHGHAASLTDPIVWIHSGTSPTGDNTEYLNLSHNRTNAYLDVGKGKLHIPTGVILGLDAATNTAGYIKMFAAGANAYYNTFTSGENTANATYTLPVAMPGTSGFVLASTTAGVMSWAAAPTAVSMTVAAEATDQTCYPLFVTGATGDLAPKTHAAFGFDALNGWLGVGTATPICSLAVQAGAGTENGTDCPVVRISTPNYGTGVLYGRLVFNCTGGGGAYVDLGAEIRGYSFTGVNQGQLTLGTANGSALVEHVLLNSVGLLGLGVLVPTSKLHVVSSTGAVNFANTTIKHSTVLADNTTSYNHGLLVDVTSVTLPTSKTDSGLRTGIVIDASLAGADFAGTQANLYGTRIYSGIAGSCTTGAAVTNAYGGYFINYNLTASTTITNSYGVYINSKQTATGTITNAWDIYAASATAYNYFAGSVGIGVAAPLYRLDLRDTTWTVASFCNTTASEYTNIILRTDNVAASFSFNANSITRAGIWNGITLAGSTFFQTIGGAQVFYTNSVAQPFIWLGTPSNPLIWMILAGSGNLLVGTTDDDGTPATGRLVVQGSTNDGTTNIFVGRDSDGVNQFVLNTDGQITTGSWHATTLAYDHGGTGLTVYPTRTILLGANSASLGTTTPCTRATRELATNKQVVDSIVFPVSGVGIAWFNFPIPDAYDSGTFIITVYYYSVTSEAANFRFQAAMSASADAEAMDVALGTTVLVTAACSGTALFQKVATFGAVTASPTPAPAHMMFLKLWRDPDEGSDNSTLDAHVTAVKIEFVASAWTD